MLHWCSLLAGNCNIITTTFAHKGGQYWHYVLMLVHSPVIMDDARPKIIDAWLMFMSRIGQGACRWPFQLSRKPILPRWMDMTMQSIHCCMGMTMNCWCSVEAQLREILTVVVWSTIVCETDTVGIDSQYIINIFNCLHPKSSRPLCF